MTERLQGQRVVVIGAGGGIGAATALAFKKSGATVVAAGRPGPKLDRVAADLGVAPAVLDILSDAAVENFFSGSEPFDHVVVAAAATQSGSVAQLPLEAARASMDSKFWGAYRVARAAKVVAGGSITLVSGVLSHRPSPTAVLQGAINAAIEALGRGLALERAPVRVNTVTPGIIDTPIWNRLADADRTALFKRSAERLPAGRIGQPNDVAQAILFVATNSFVTGTTVMVDGGGAIAG